MWQAEGALGEFGQEKFKFFLVIDSWKTSYSQKLK